MGMPGFAGQGSRDYPLALGSVHGYRWWCLDAPDMRRSPLDADRNWPRGDLTGQAGGLWFAGENIARCRYQPAEHDPIEESCGCVTPGTRVLTADLRWVPAGDLVVGEELFAFDEYPASSGYGDPSGRKYRSAVVASTERGTLPCYDLQFDDGTEIRVSADHQWLIYAGQKAAHWVRTDELRAGDLRASRVVKPFEPWDTDESRGAGYLAAAFDGEGNLFQHGGRYQFRVAFTQVGNPMLDEVERELKERSYRFTHTIAPHGYVKSLRVDGSPRQDVHRLTISSRPDMLRFLGSVRPLRLLPKVQPDGFGRLNMDSRVRLVSKVYAGEQEVVKLGTTTGTYFAEGLASHNCGFWAYWAPPEVPHFRSDQLWLLGVIKGSGRTYFGTEGFRCQRATIVALHLASQFEVVTPAGGSWFYDWRQVFTQPGTYQPPPGRPVMSQLTAPRMTDAELAEAMDRMRTWQAVIEDRLEGRYPDARIIAERRALLALYPPYHDRVSG